METLHKFTIIIWATREKQQDHYSVKVTASTKNAIINRTNPGYLEHMITYPSDDVRVIFLLQVSIVLGFVFLIGSKKLAGSSLCRCPMKSALAAYPETSAQITSI